MHLGLLYLFRNLTRNRLRSALTCAAVGLPITIFVLTSSVIDGIERFLDNSSRQLRLVVTQKTSIVNPLPVGDRIKMESLDPSHQRLVAVCGFRWVGGKLENDPRPLSILAGDPDTFAATFPEHLRSAAEHDAWLRDRRALIVGRATAAQFGWKVGDRVTIRASVPPYSLMQFLVVSTAPDAADALTCFCRRDYIEEEVKRTGWAEDIVHFFFVKCATKADLEYFRRAIDELFANSSDETLTQDEKSFMNQFITQQFNLPRNLSILAAITIAVAVLAATNTMGMNFRDRFNEYATLRAMGFKPPRVFGLIQSESLLLCGTGGLLGALGPYIAFTWTPLRDYTVPLIQHVEVHPSVCLIAIAIAVGIGLLAAAWPSWSAARLKVVEAFRLLE